MSSEDDIARLHAAVPALRLRYAVQAKIGEGTFSAVFRAKLLDRPQHSERESEPKLKGNRRCREEDESADNDDKESDDLVSESGPQRSVKKPRLNVVTDTQQEHAIPTESSEVNNEKDEETDDEEDEDENENENEEDDDADAKSDNEDKENLVALKYIFPTSSAERIANEISLLHELKGLHNVVSLKAVSRAQDVTVLVLPYFPHRDFREYFSTMTLRQIAAYMRSLFDALAHLHAHNILHRDIKPSNFLYNIDEERGLLIDFGLAHKLEDPSLMPAHARTKSISGTNSTNMNNRGVGNHTSPQSITLQPRTPSKSPMNPLGISMSPFQRPGPPLPGSYVRWRQSAAAAEIERKPYVIAKDKDPRPGMKVCRAGTRGFRAPEVLFKAPKQTLAIDVWSAGVILLSLLLRRFPVFHSPDDFAALQEIAHVIGSKSLDAAARTSGRKLTFSAEVPRTGPGWICLIAKDELIETSARSSCPSDSLESTESDIGNTDNDKDISEHEKCFNDAMDLLAKCLNPDPSLRITCAEALTHRFLLQAVPSSPS